MTTASARHQDDWAVHDMLIRAVRALTSNFCWNCCTRTWGLGPCSGSGKLSWPSMVFFAFAATCCVLPSEAPACTESQVAAELESLLTSTAWRECHAACSSQAAGQVRAAFIEPHNFVKVPLRRWYFAVCERCFLQQGWAGVQPAEVASVQSCCHCCHQIAPGDNKTHHQSCRTVIGKPTA